MKNLIGYYPSLFLILFIASIFAPSGSNAQTITSVSRVVSPGLPNAGLIVNGGFETGAPPVDTWYQWAKTGCNPAPGNRRPPSWTVTAHNSNSFGGSPIRYATWGRLVTGTGAGGPYPFIPTNQSGVYEVYSTGSTACTITNTTATSSDPGTFPLGVASVDGNNYLYFGNGTGSVTGFPAPLASWVSSTGAPDNLRVYNDNSSLGTLTGPAPVTLSQTVATTAGAAYVLEFWVSGEELNVGSQKDGFFRLQIGTQNLYLAIPGSANDHGLGNQFYYRVQFNAAAATTLIRFVNYCHVADASWSSYLAGGIGAELLLDDVRMNLATALPVQLLSFTANAYGTNVNLYWRTAAEVNFSHFEIEHSLNGDGTFTKISHMVSHNRGTGEYRYSDEVNDYAQNKTVFYRLKMVDKDGYVEYSTTVAVKLHDRIPVLVFPSLVKKGVPITIEKAGDFQTTGVQLADLNGRILQRKPFNGMNSVKIETSGLPAGVYIIAVTGLRSKDTYKVMVE
jgi:hypothetical protein